MGLKKRMNETARVYEHDFAGQTTEMSAEDQSRFLAWLRARLYDLGVLEAMAPSTKPPELRINTSTVLFYIAVLGFIAAGFWWTWQRADEAGYQRGVIEQERKNQEAEMKELKRQIDYLKAVKEAEQQEQAK